MTKFKERAKLDLSQVNQEVLNKWNAEDVFHKSISEREGHPEFIFFEGPPSANGHPGIHHVMGRTIKDTFLRYKTMQGFQVKRKAGWDTHGLPVELEVEKMLGLNGKDQIEQANQVCPNAIPDAECNCRAQDNQHQNKKYNYLRNRLHI